MKKLLFLLILGSITSFGQQKVYQRDIFEANKKPEKVSISAYPNLTLLNGKGKNTTPTVSDVDARKMNYDFFKFAQSRNIRFTDFKGPKYIPCELLFNKDGKVDFLIYGFKKTVFRNNNFKFDSLSTEETSIFVNLAEEFCQNYTFKPKNHDGAFSLHLSINFGKEQRKVSKKSISTIEMAQNCDEPDTVKALMLNKLYLESFPEVVFRFKNLEKLDLSDNYIEQVPSKIWNLKKLKFLSLSGNYVDYANFSFKRNKHLKDLNLQYTGMTQMPKSLKRNRRLEILFIGNNPIKFAKNDFNRMAGLKALNLYNVRTSILPKSIQKLQKLEELDLYHNDLQFLPTEICQLKNLKTLALSNNQLWNLPEEMSKLTNLQTLYAHHNRLNSLPNLPNLKLLDLGYNLFKVFPEQVYELKDLEEFDITNNKVEEVPEKLLALKKLQKVYIRGNEFYNVDEKSKKVSKLVAGLEQRQVLVR
jgi:Leucine-rich repeat (LRR) protein